MQQQYRLVLNAGSSSLKFKLYAYPEDEVCLSGLVERIGEQNARLKITTTTVTDEANVVAGSHQSAMEMLVDRWKKLLNEPNLGDKICLVGHRVVHGGEYFKKPALINAEVKQTIQKLSVLAPLHNPANLTGIEVSEKVFPKAIQVAVFDTAFHQTMPAKAYRYAIPESLYQKEAIRVYGFHGTSHKYVSSQARNWLSKEGLKSERVITLHLGNGCSMAAIKDGICIDTSMGLSPLAGLMMGTRSGDVDPSIYLFLSKKGYKIDEIDRILNKESGLLGISGVNDLRELSSLYKKSEPLAVLAMDMYVYRIKKFIGAYAVAMGGLDAIIFTAGVGENSTLIRSLVCEDIGFLGINIDSKMNDLGTFNEVTSLSQPNSSCQILVIPTDEEIEILNESTEQMNLAHN